MSLPARRERIVAAILGVLLLLAAGVAPGFYDPRTLRILAGDLLPVAVAAAGMTLVILAGQIDVSVGSIFAVAGVLAGLLARAGLPNAAVIALTLLGALAFGAVNGALVAGLGVPAIVATLATLSVGRGAVRLLTGGAWIQDLPPSFVWFGLEQGAGQAAFAAAALALVAGCAAALRWVSACRSIPAVGCDAEAARLAGLRPRATVFAVFLAAGGLAGAAALLSVPRFPVIDAEAGLGFELRVIAAVVLGGTSVSGGRGTIAGTLLGVLLLGVLGALLVSLRVDAAWERAVQGIVILAAVAAEGRRRALPRAEPGHG